MASLPSERLCQICGRMKRIPEEIPRSGHPTCKPCQIERNRAGARHRYYVKAGVPDGWRLCRWCGLPKQVGVDMTTQGRTCQTCQKERALACSRRTRRERIARMNAAELKADRAKHAAKARRARSTPEGRARHNAGQKAWRESHPGAAAAAQKRYRQKIKADPERYREWMENQRIYHRIWRERKGMVPHLISEQEYRNGNGAHFNGAHLPAAPLAHLISEWIGEWGSQHDAYRPSLTFAGYDQLAELTGLSARTLGRIVLGKHDAVKYATADAICTAIGLPMAVLYPQEEL